MRHRAGWYNAGGGQMDAASRRVVQRCALRRAEQHACVAATCRSGRLYAVVGTAVGAADAGALATVAPEAVAPEAVAPEAVARNAICNCRPSVDWVSGLVRRGAPQGAVYAAGGAHR